MRSPPSTPTSRRSKKSNSSGSKNSLKSPKTPGKRRLKRPSFSSPGQIPNPITNKDDESEKKQLRKQQKQRRRSSLPGVQNYKNEKILNQNELTNIYANAIKLATAGKINQNNTWTIQLIDHMDDVLQISNENRENLPTNFQKASCTLEASVKIYSTRVDSMHQETYKVLGGLVRSDSRRTKAENPENDEEEDEEGSDKKKKDKKKKTTVEKNPNSLNVKKFDLSFNVDPMFHKTASVFDESGAKGMLLNRLQTFGECQVIFDSSVRLVDFDKEEHEEDMSVDITAFTRGFNGLGNLELCPEFAEFRAMLDCEENVAENVVSEDEDHEHSEEEIIEAGAEGFLDDFEDLDVEEEIEPLTLSSESQLSEDVERQSVIDSSGLVSAFEMIGITSESGDAENDDYTYFKRKDWGGMVVPSHWKFQKPSKSLFTSSAKKAPAKRKETFYLDFTQGELDESEMKILRIGKPGSNLLKEASLKLARKNVHLLPMDMEILPSRFRQLFLNKRFVMRDTSRKDSKVESEDRISSEAVDDEMLGVGDSGNYEYDDIDIDDSGRIEEESSIFSGVGHDLTLIDEPMKAQKVHIGFAKRAKKVDVRALKKSIWEYLDDEEPSSVEEKPQVEEEKSFQTMIENVYVFRFVLQAKLTIQVRRAVVECA